MVTRNMENSSALVTEARFIGQGRDEILADVENIFWLTLGRVGVRSPDGALY